MGWTRFGRVVVFLVLTAGTAQTAPLAAAGDEPSVIGPAGEDPSVVSLVADYGLSVPQARAQMEMQVAAGQAELEMPQELAEVYSGRQIFHDRGGHVAVGLTDVSRGDALKQHFARFGVTTVELQRFTATNAQLDELVEGGRASLRTSRAAAAKPMVELSRRSLGKVTVRVVNGTLNNAEAGLVATAAASPDLYSVVNVEEIVASEEEACDFTGDIECDPPLRGSVRITEGGICSAGFNVRSRTNALPYVLTAGHCDDGAGRWATQFADESSHFIGPFHRSRNDTVTDAGILRVDNPSGWSFGRPWITVDPTGGHAVQQAYVIERVLNAGLGDRVCVTMGNSARTNCGEVTDTSVTGGGTAGLFEVDRLCTEGGDSGSPYFSFHVAYGIHSSGDGVTGTVGCRFGRAEHAIEASAQMNSRILTG